MCWLLRVVVLSKYVLKDVSCVDEAAIFLFPFLVLCDFVLSRFNFLPSLWLGQVCRGVFPFPPWPFQGTWCVFARVANFNFISLLFLKLRMVEWEKKSVVLAPNFLLWSTTLRKVWSWSGPHCKRKLRGV